MFLCQLTSISIYFVFFVTYLVIIVCIVLPIESICIKFFVLHLLVEVVWRADIDHCVWV